MEKLQNSPKNTQNLPQNWPTTDNFSTRNKLYYDSMHFSVKEIADYMRMSRVAVFKWIQKGELPASRIGRSYIVSLGDLERYLQTEVDLNAITINRLWME